MKKTTQAVGNRRLLALAKFLRALPGKRFDYTRWVGYNWQGAQDLSCGTTACALGWAATIPQFRRLGLHWNLGGYPELGRRRPMEAAEVLFALDFDGAEHLFTPSSTNEDHATPKQVARKIERFVAQRVRGVPALATQDARHE